jgi:putative FmdB family regulatory protein
MPIYEYRCADCGRRPAIFFRSMASVEATPACPHCGGRHLDRLISRTAQVLSEDSRLDRLSDSADLADVDENDPKSVARWAKRMGREMGGDEMGEDFDQVVDEMGDAPDGAGETVEDDDEL